MRETTLAEMFDRFETDVLTTFRPPGVADARRRTRRRRQRRRGVLAGLAALLLAGPAGAYATAGRGDPPPPPAPSPSPSPALTPLGRVNVVQVRPPGVVGELTALTFLDARTGWALFDTCPPGEGGTGCRRTVLRTTDGGGNWGKVDLPPAPNGPAHLLPVDDRTLDRGGRPAVPGHHRRRRDVP